MKKKHFLSIALAIVLASSLVLFNSAYKALASQVFSPGTSSGGTGTGNVATSTHEVANQVPYFTSTSATPATIGGSTNFTFNGTTATLNTLNLTNPLTQSYGGMGTSSLHGVTNGIEFDNGSYITNNANLTTDSAGDIFSGGAATLGSGSNLWFTGPSPQFVNGYIASSSGMTSMPVWYLDPSTGNMGLGSTSPSSRLSIMDWQGYGSVATHLDFDIGSSTMGVSTTTIFSVDSGGNLTLPVNGARLGVGTTTPAGILDIEDAHAGSVGGLDAFFGDTGGVISSTTYPFLFSHKSPGSAGGSFDEFGFNYYLNSSGSSATYNQNLGGWAFASDARATSTPSLQLNAITPTSAASTLLTFLPNGPVGFATATPVAKLDIYTSVSSSTPLLLESTGATGGCIIVKDAVAGASTYTQIWTAGGVVHGSVHSGSLSTCN